MGKPEGFVEKYLRARVVAHGGVCWKFMSSIDGVPDRVIVLNGRTLFVETKAKGKQLRALQKVRRDEILAAGGDMRVIDNRPDVDALIQELTGVIPITALETKDAA